MIKYLSHRYYGKGFLAIDFEINGVKFNRSSCFQKLLWWKNYNEGVYYQEEESLELESIVKAYFDTEGKFKEQLQIEN